MLIQLHEHIQTLTNIALTHIPEGNQEALDELSRVRKSIAELLSRMACKPEFEREA